MSKLINLFRSEKRKTVKHQNYFQVYDEYLHKYVDKNITFVEIGIANGGSLKVWKNYFKNARIIGIDLNDKCKIFEEEGIEVVIGDQADPKFWKNFFQKIGKVDVIIDDGGHTNLQQIITTTECIPNIKDGGILLIEDVMSSYISSFDNPSKFSFINFSKKLVDDINFNDPSLGKFKFSLNQYIHAIKFFEGIVIFEINRSKILPNIEVDNNGKTLNIEDLRQEGIGNYGGFVSYIKRKTYFFKKIKIFIKIYNFFAFFFKFFKKIKNEKKYKSFFK